MDEVLIMNFQQVQDRKGRRFQLLCLAIVIATNIIFASPVAIAKFDPMLFIQNNTTFFSDFRALREKWFAVEDRISSIKDVYEPVDWAAIRNSAKQVVMIHERLMVKLARDCRSSRSKLLPGEADQAQRTIELVLEYIDSVGLVVLKLYEISEKLYNKTVNPYSYTMSDYNSDMKQFKKLNEAFEKKGNSLNLLFYGK